MVVVEEQLMDLIVEDLVVADIVQGGLEVTMGEDVVVVEDIMEKMVEEVIQMVILEEMVVTRLM
jgi:hypothetical protein